MGDCVLRSDGAGMQRGDSMRGKGFVRLGLQPASIRVASSFWSRLRGLLGRNPEPGVLLLVPCADVHTFGMRHPIDVAFVDWNGMVIEAYKSVEPNRRLSNKRACAVIEQFSLEGSAWVLPGDALLLGALKADEEKGKVK